MKLEKEIDILEVACHRVNKDKNDVRIVVLFKNCLSNEEMSKLANIHRKYNAKLILEAEEPILDEVEKKYLSGVIRPFRDRIEFIKKLNEHYIGDEYILIKTDSNLTPLPYFKKGTMYKKMVLNKEYTLEELGL